MNRLPFVAIAAPPALRGMPSEEGHELLYAEQLGFIPLVVAALSAGVKKYQEKREADKAERARRHGKRPAAHSGVDVAPVHGAHTEAGLVSPSSFDPKMILMGALVIGGGYLLARRKHRPRRRRGRR